MLDNIPNELRLLPQWVVAGPNKIPINPRTGQPADPTNPETWATFHEARQAGYQHVGFVLHHSDPYTIIDLDAPGTPEQAARQKLIFGAFQSYAELSQSGNGVHIICRGAVPTGVRRDKVEVYSDARYMICTGRVISPLPIADYQPLLTQLHQEMQSTTVAALEERDAIISDEQLWDMAANAVNGDKFKSLWGGDLSTYPSQSEADFALLSILAFYTKADEQVRRLFRMCVLGQRDKATKNNDYLDRALGKIRGKQAKPEVDLSHILRQPLDVPNSVATPPAATAPAIAPALPPVPVQVQLLAPPPEPPPASANRITLPPGLLGEMADYIYSSAIRPVWEVALSASLAFGAGMVARHYNISSTGLNQFIILLAPTGTGKEGAVGGIDAMMSAIRPQVPAADDFVGPGTFASGQALTRVLDKSPCFVSILGEVGITLQQICDRNAGSHNVQLRKVLLDVYAKSGWNKWLRPSVYSDSEKNTAIVRAPNVTILGESTPENFYSALDQGHIMEGLVPRFFVLEYNGPRPPINNHAFHHPSAGLTQRLVTVCQTVLTMRNNETCMPVQTDRWASGLLEVFNVQADDRINGAGESELLKQLWNRAHIKALKLAGLVAVGCNLNQPIVTKEIAQWAIDLVHRDIDNMTTKFSEGEVGVGDHTQEADIRKAVYRYGNLTAAQREGTYRVPKILLDKPQLVPYVYLKRSLILLASFKNDKRGAVTAMKISLDDCIKGGMLKMIPPDQARKEFSLDSPIYYRGENW